jgi:hypothetical protein
MSQTNQPKKTRLKGTKTEKTCVACGVSKNRLKDFKPRWSRCAKHRIKGTKGDPNCADCETLKNGVIRQPRCVECDSKRTTKKGKKVTSPTPVVAAPVAAPTPAPTPEPVTVAPVVTAQEPAAPEATSVQAPAPTEPTPVETPVALVTVPTPTKKAGLNKLADLAKLLDDSPTSDTGSDSSPL